MAGEFELHPTKEKIEPNNAGFGDSGGERPGALIGEFVQSALYGMQAPIKGAMQTIEQTTKLDIPDVNLVAPPKPAAFGTAEWHVQSAGIGVGSAVPFLAFSLGVGKLASRAGGTALASNAASEWAQFVKVGSGVPAAAVRGAATGFVYEGLTAPIESANAQLSGVDFWKSRLERATVGAITFGALAGTTHGIMQAGRYYNMREQFMLGSTLRSPIFAGAASGALAGPISAEAGSLLHDGKHASIKDMAQSAYSYAFMGATMGALQEPFRQKYMVKAEETDLTRQIGTIKERRQEAHDIRREINMYGEEPGYVLEHALKREGVRVLAIGEEHTAFGNGMRDATLEALPAMKRAGANIFAIELPDNLQPYLDRWLRTGSTDFYRFSQDIAAKNMRMLENDPLMDMVRAAHKLRMKVVAVDHPNRSLESARDVHMAERIVDILRQEPDSKVVYYGGNLHTGATRSSVSSPSLVTALREKLGTPNQPNDSAVVGVLSIFNTDTPLNLQPVAGALEKPVAVPMNATWALADAPLAPVIGLNSKTGQWDYLMMFPQRQVSIACLEGLVEKLREKNSTPFDVLTDPTLPA